MVVGNRFFICILTQERLQRNDVQRNVCVRERTARAKDFATLVLANEQNSSKTRSFGSKILHAPRCFFFFSLAGSVVGAQPPFQTNIWKYFCTCVLFWRPNNPNSRTFMSQCGLYAMVVRYLPTTPTIATPTTDHHVFCQSQDEFIRLQVAVADDLS